MKYNLILFGVLILGVACSEQNAKDPEKEGEHNVPVSSDTLDYEGFAVAFCDCHKAYFAMQDQIEREKSSDLAEIEKGVMKIRQLAEEMKTCLAKAEEKYQIKVSREDYPLPLLKVLEAKCPRLFPKE